ncbi:MAG: DinB family protein [Bacteroidota bacterium]
MESNKEIHLLLQLVGEAYEKRAWQGTNLRGSIRGLTAQEAAWRPAPDRHNIWEIVVHAAYWKYIVRRRLLREKKASFPLKGSNWIKRPIVMSKNAWREDIRLLNEMHRSMCEAIALLKPSDLNLKPAGSKFTNASIISGIACHDVYHTGQIQLLKRLMKQ